MADLVRLQSALTSTHHQWTYPLGAKCPHDLRELLCKELPHIAQDSWENRFWLGGVHVNGREALGNRVLATPCKVEYFEPRFDIEQPQRVFPRIESKHFIYKDEDLLVVYKPAGLPSLPNREQRRFSLKTSVEQHLKRSVHCPSRLDTSTQGLVAISTSARMHARLQRAFERKLVTKYYVLETSDPVDWLQLTASSRIARDDAHPVLRKSVRGSGKTAVTHFTRLAPRILLAQPLTGRTHQIRIHAKEVASPIVGDNFYGGSPASQLRLISWGLELLHPFTQRKLRITSPTRLLPEWLEQVQDRLSPS